jgi:hypothetical protein
MTISTIFDWFDRVMYAIVCLMLSLFSFIVVSPGADEGRSQMLGDWSDTIRRYLFWQNPDIPLPGVTTMYCSTTSISIRIPQTFNVSISPYAPQARQSVIHKGSKMRWQCVERHHNRSRFRRKSWGLTTLKLLSPTT